MMGEGNFKMPLVTNDCEIFWGGGANVFWVYPYHGGNFKMPLVSNDYEIVFILDGGENITCFGNIQII